MRSSNEAMRLFLQRNVKRKREPIPTAVACNAASFFKSSEPRFAISRVDSVRSCLLTISLAEATPN